VALRELVLTTDRDHGPETLIPIRNDLYWEGFDGCGNGTFSLWEQVSGTWTVQSKDPMQDPTEKAVIGRSTDAALLTLKADEWENVDINVSVQTLKSANTGSYVGVCFGLEGPDQYFLLRWRDVPQMRMADMQVLKRSSRNEGVVANLQVPWPEATWHNVCISLRAGAVAVSVDGGKEAHVAIADSIAGGIGLYLSGNTSASFDNISIRSAAPNPEPVRPGLKMSQMNRPCSSQ
jgi:hypothetical protein